MPHDGSMILSDVRGPTLAIVCEPCGRRDRASKDRVEASGQLLQERAEPQLAQDQESEFRQDVTAMPIFLCAH